MSTFNGWPIISLPAYPPAPASIEWEPFDTVAAARSPFSQQQQLQNWQAAILRASLSYQPMTPSQAIPWIVFLMNTQGISSVFQFGDPLLTGPQNPSASAGHVSGGGQTGYALDTTASGLTPGDWIQIGYRLYRVMTVSGGNLGIWPNIRESPADGSAISITNTSGLFRLTKSARRYTVNKAKIHGITFEIEEAL
jgi:hypothetical protein